MDVEQASRQEQMVQQQIIDRGIKDPRVIAVIRATPRERFFPEESRRVAFADRAAPIGHGQSISQPYMAALMTQRLAVREQDKVLEIGTGCGYHTALLARLGREVYTIERVKPLLDGAWERLISMGVRNVHYRFGDGTLGWPEAAPFDRILIAAGAPRMPVDLLLSDLADGGIAVLPVGPADEQMLVEVRREGDRLHSADICPCRFVKLIGKEGWGLGEA
jgi:protein-L-isoaspartate(D-aspartate) O-methyltransferase